MSYKSKYKGSEIDSAVNKILSNVNIDNVTLITPLTSDYKKVQLPNIDTTNKIIDFGHDAVITIGSNTTALRSTNSNYRSVSFANLGSGAINVCCNVETFIFTCREYSATILQKEVVVGTMRFTQGGSTNFLDANFPFKFTINGKPPIDAKSITGDMIADRTVTRDKIAYGAIGNEQIDPDYTGTILQIYTESEKNANKVTTISDNSTDEQYPSAKAVNTFVKANGLTDGSVTTSKLADGSVTTEKLGTDVLNGIQEVYNTAISALPINNLVYSDDGTVDYDSQIKVPAMQLIQDEIMSVLNPLAKALSSAGFYIAGDAEVQRVLTEKFDTDDDGVLLNSDIQNIKSLEGVFAGNAKIKKFIANNWYHNCTPNHAIFNGCSNLKKLIWQTKTPKISGYIGQITENCDKIEEIDLTGWDMSGVTQLGVQTDYLGLFGCAGDTNRKLIINLTGWDLSNNTSLRKSFCAIKTHGGEFIGIEDFNTSNVTDMYCTFFNTYFRTINIENWDWSNVTNTGWMFRACLFIRELTLPANSQCSKSTNFSNFLFNCNELTTINNFENIDVSKATDISHFFELCSSLEVVDLTNWDCGNVTSDVASFISGSSLQSLVGELSDEEVADDDNISIMNGLAANIDITQLGRYIKKAYLGAGSMLALFRGLADLTGQTTKTITIDQDQMNKCIDYYGIATSKNWTFNVV